MSAADDPRVSEILRRRQATYPGRCVHCKGRLNAFAPERCPHCRLDQPNGHDLKPLAVNRSAAAPPPPPARPEPSPEPEPEPEDPAMIATPEAPPALVKQTRACPTCGKPTNPHNGRCYACRPGGGAGKSPPAPKSPRNRVAPQIPAATPVNDPEVAAIARALDALAGLDADQVGRVLDYVSLRARCPKEAR